MRTIILDIETTGLEAAQVLSIGMIEYDTMKRHAFDLTLSVEANLVEAGLRWDHFMIKRKKLYGEPYALMMNADLIKAIAYDHESLVDIKDVDTRLFTFLGNEKWTLAGKNVRGFDLPILLNDIPFGTRKEEFVKLFRHRALDVGPMFARKDDAAPPDLQTCLERAGYSNYIVRHDALADCFACLLCFNTFFHQEA